VGFLALLEGARCFGVAGAAVLRVVGIVQSGATDASAPQSRRARLACTPPTTRLSGFPLLYSRFVELFDRSSRYLLLLGRRI
jgi:hypothetical protein